MGRFPLQPHWSGNIVILMKFSSQAALEPRKLSFWQLPLQLMMKISSQWWYFHFSALQGLLFWKSVMTSGGCFTNVSRALQSNLTKIYNAIIYIYGENFKLKLCTCDQSIVLGTDTNFQLEIVIRNMIFYNTQISREYFRELVKH